MEKDARLAQEVRAGRSEAILRTYGWVQPCITLGRIQRIEDLPSQLRDSGLPMVHRPTGGGAVVHQPGEVTYAVAAQGGGVGRVRDFPQQLHSELKRILGMPLEICPPQGKGPVTVCFSQPVCGDLLYQGKKIAGSALRAWRDGFLLQGSLQGFPIPSDRLLTTLVQAVRITLVEKVYAEAGT